MTMLHSLRSMTSGHGPDGPGLRKPTKTIHYYHPLQVLFQQLSWKINPKAPRVCPWPWSTPWGLWPLGMAQMVLVSGNQLKPFIIIILHRFCLSNFAEKSNPGPQGSVHDHALPLEVYGLWAWPRWSWPLETNSNHSLLSWSTTFVSQVYPENLKGIQK